MTSSEQHLNLPPEAVGFVFLDHMGTADENPDLVRGLAALKSHYNFKLVSCSSSPEFSTHRELKRDGVRDLIDDIFSTASNEYYKYSREAPLRRVGSSCHMKNNPELWRNMHLFIDNPDAIEVDTSIYKYPSNEVSPDIELVKLNPEYAFLIDDVTENCAGLIEAGGDGVVFPAVKYNDPDDAKQAANKVAIDATENWLKARFAKLAV